MSMEEWHFLFPKTLGARYRLKILTHIIFRKETF